ncbi:MAG: DUF2007 domain-containing protein [Bacteroidales bacterium]|nr:DUF2007 domain-containing protein [Bacteroidales bacterium]
MENEWKKVHSTDKEYKAVIIREKLAEKGIESSQVNKKGSEIDLFIGEIEIYVFEKDIEKANEIITKHSEL